LDGSAWTDFATLEYPNELGPPVTGGVLFLKGITAVPEPSTLLLVLAAATIAFTAQRIHRGPEAKERARALVANRDVSLRSARSGPSQPPCSMPEP
jgi:hypothetical protein